MHMLTPLLSNPLKTHLLLEAFPAEFFTFAVLFRATGATGVVGM